MIKNHNILQICELIFEMKNFNLETKTIFSEDLTLNELVFLKLHNTKTSCSNIFEAQQRMYAQTKGYELIFDEIHFINQYTKREPIKLKLNFCVCL